MSIFSTLKETLTVAQELQTLPVLRERLSLAQEQLAVAEKNVIELEAENKDLLRENRELRKQLEVYKKEDEYLNLGICCIKKNPQGGYFKSPFCPNCKNSLSRGYMGKYFCGPCDYHVDILEVDAAIRNHT